MGVILVQHIQTQLRKLIKRCRTNNPFQICLHKNITCLEAHLHEDIKGFSLFFEKNWIIILNKNLSIEEKKFRCGHELGHIILHKECKNIYLNKDRSIDRNNNDKEADFFSRMLNDYDK
jgi:Zn-dependent peptidase ImmA (M78 family)